MTKCNRSEVNLKSSAYNQNGQNYFEQLTAYNSMNSHLRRILLAKCVVDARNKNYIHRRKQLCKDIGYKPICSKTAITNDVIDRLAYDTLHHPADFLRMTYNSRYLCQREERKYFTDCYNYDVICSRSRLRDHVICPSSPIFKSNKFPPFVSTDENIKRRAFTRSKPVNAKSAIKIQDISEPRFGDNSIVYETTSDLITQEVNHFSSTGSSGSSRSYENYETAPESVNMTSDHRKYRKGGEPKYAKFVYEITREIVRRNLYTDKELQEVFDKHLEQNRTILDKNKMLYEIYHLKLALNVTDEADDEELDDVIHAQQLVNMSELRPPTPPKVLNENKLIEKLRPYDTEIAQKSETDRRKSVVLIDANPELVVTERDVISSLIEANINPEQAFKICKQLSYKSKNPLPMHKASQSSNTTTRDNDSPVSNLNEPCKMQKKNGEEKSCTTCDLVAQENKNVQIEQQK